MLVLLAALPMVAVQTFEFTPTDDVWVYAHAGDPAKDAYLRIWGDGENSVVDADQVENVSYAYLKFNITGLPADKKIVGATLTVTQVSGAAYDADMAKAAPLEVRPVSSAFDEKAWNYDEVSKMAPLAGAKGLFGSGFPQSVDKDHEFTIDIDLLKGENDFRAYASGQIGLALCSRIDVEQNRASYKVYSKDAERSAVRPVLRIETE